jgi:hypothetical protein
MVEDPRKTFKGADLMKGIDQRWMKNQDLEQRKAVNGFLQFQRDASKNLQTSLRTLRDLLFEARRCGYDPDDQTLISKFEGMLTDDEKTLHTLLKNTDKEGGGEFDICVRAMEELAKDRQNSKPKANTDFAGGAQARDGNGSGRGGRGGRGRGRGGQNSQRRTGFAQDADERADKLKKCKWCGSSACKSLNGGRREDCRAFDEECRVCKKRGHFGVVCRSAGGKQAAAGAATTTEQKNKPAEQREGHSGF